MVEKINAKIDFLIAERKTHKGKLWRGFDAKENALKELKKRLEGGEFTSAQQINNSIQSWLAIKKDGTSNEKVLNTKRRLAFLPRYTGKTATLSAVRGLDAKTIDTPPKKKRGCFGF